MDKKQEENYNEIRNYNIEYKNAIKKLMEIDDINDVLSPLTALIMQYVENYLKAILQDFFEVEKTARDLKIDHHKCKKLLNSVKEKYNKYLGINIVECINYLEGIYGENTMINARYPLDSKTLTVNRKEHTVFSEEYKLMFTILRYAIENLIQFYELEKTYQKVINTSKPKEQLQDYINFCNREYNKPNNIIKINIIQEIDKCNENFLNI